MEILKKIDGTFQGCTPKVVETPKFLIFNGQLYDKNDLYPLKLDSIDLSDISFSSWGPVLYRSINTCCNVGNNYFQLAVKNLHYHMVEDSCYPNRFYLMAQKNSCGSWFRVYEECEDKETGKHYYKMLMEHSLGEYFNAYCHMIYYGGDYEIMYQNDEYVLGKMSEPHGVDGPSWSNWGTNYNHLFKLDKLTLTFTYIQNIHAIGDASYNHYFLKHVLGYDYIYVQYLAEHYVMRYDVFNTMVTLYTNNEEGVQISGNPVQIGEYWYYYVDGFSRTGKHEYQLCRIIVHEDNVEHEYVSIEDSYLLDIDPSTHGMTNINHILTHESKTIILDNANYIITVARSQANGTWYKTQHKLFVLKMEQDKAVVKQVISFAYDPCKGVLSYYEEEGHADVLITIHEQGIRFWKFDYEQEKYSLVYERIGEYYWLGMDELKRVYMQHSNGSLDIITCSEAATLKAYFKDQYIDETQDTVTLCYWAKDYFNEYIEERVTIRLSEGVEFQDGTRQKVLTTSANGPIEIELNITATTNIKAQVDITGGRYEDIQPTL